MKFDVSEPEATAYGDNLKKQKARDSDAENLFGRQLHEAGIAGYKRQFEFLPSRKYAADFYWPAVRLIVEIDGGVFGIGRLCKCCRTNRPGGHTSGVGYTSNRVRDAEAFLAGYITLRFTTQQVKDGYALTTTIKALAQLRTKG